MAIGPEGLSPKPAGTVEDYLNGLDGPSDEDLLATLEDPDALAGLEEFNPADAYRPFYDASLLGNHQPSVEKKRASGE